VAWVTVPPGAQLPRPPRLFIADDIYTGRVQLDGYPFRYIIIGSSPSRAFSTAFSGRQGANHMLDAILSAVEFLEDRGWDLVSVDQGGTIAVMRRRPVQDTPG
jgi:hypothetical protein